MTTRVDVTATITSGEVAVFRFGVVPLVTTEVSVTVAVRLYVPGAVGTHVVEAVKTPAVKDPPPTIPIEVPLTKKLTDETWVPAGLVPIPTETLNVIPAGVLDVATVEAFAGAVMVIVGVARASGAASKATKVAAAARDRRRIVFMDGPPGGRLLTWRRCGCGLRRWRG
jgi:hypothetical protein